MRNIKNILCKTIIVAMAAWIVGPMAAMAARDETLDFQCRPRWDRFIVDENTTQWNRDSMACYDKFGNEVDVFKMYGTESVHGHIDDDGKIILKSDAPDVHCMYGDPECINARNMYGDGNTVGVKKNKPAPIRAAEVPVKNNNPKSPIKPKPVVPPRHADAPKPVTPPIVVPEKTVPVVEPNLPTPVQKPKPAPDKKAKNIATSLNNTTDVDSYCENISPAVLGPLPRGLVLMPGRPDQMSCVKN